MITALKRYSLCAAALLAGCQSPVEKEQLIRSDADSRLETRIIELERKVQDLESKAQEIKTKAESAESMAYTAGDLASSTYNAHESLRKVVNKNADIENQQAIRDMTDRGACGRENVYYPDGGWSVRNKPCTMKDLRH